VSKAATIAKQAVRQQHDVRSKYKATAIFVIKQPGATHTATHAATHTATHAATHTATHTAIFVIKQPGAI